MGNPASMVETVPVGYRFHPTDEELVGHYLKHRLLGDDSGVHNIIAEVDVCNPLDLKCTKSMRCNRKTKTGYWKITGKDRNIKTRVTNKVIGTKKTLVFYKSCGRRRDKTNWVIHEYHAVTFPNDKRDFVLCRLIKKPEKTAEGGADELIHDEGEPSSHVASDYESKATADRDPDVCASSEVNLESFFPAPPLAEEYDFLLPQQSPVVTEEAPNFQDYSFLDSFFWG
ncbi:NAC domain [Sesbania bispinosa]|nr:NAC domain [Sesbania bispinosa]